MMTKSKLLRGSKTVVINIDDKYSRRIKELLPEKKMLTFGITNTADYRGSQVKTSLNNTSFVVNYRGKQEPEKFEVKTQVIGDFNVENMLAAIAVAKILGINDTLITKSIADFKLPKGRLEVITSRPCLVVVDFAHTPGAFFKILPFIKKNTDGKLIHIFGATGKRDAGKRPLMGEISAKNSDILILTSEDTYGEEPEKIIADIEKGVTQFGKKLNKDYFIEPDRKKAIALGLSMVNPFDTVIITGVGHQESLNVGNKEVPWSEKEVVLRLLNDLSV